MDSVDADENGDDMQRLAAEQQERSLVPLKDDLAEWMRKLLGIDIRVDNFMEVLDNGVQVCRLANLIQSKATDCQQDAKMPTQPIKFRQNAQSGTWFARDNTASFLQWCGDYGIKVECMFETDDLVLHKQQRSVVLCLLELARVACRFGIEPPAIISLEKEIENELEEGGGEGVIPELRDKCVIIEDHKGDGDTSSQMVTAGFMENVTVRKNRSHSVDTGLRSEKRPVSSPLVDKCPPSPARPRQSQLDKEVGKLSSKCKCCKQFHITRLREGTYNVGGKTVFIRLLKGKHLMVRVGGGWDTLEHFLTRHDPCRIIPHKRLVSGSIDAFNREDKLNYLVVQGKYKQSKR